MYNIQTQINEYFIHVDHQLAKNPASIMVRFVTIPKYGKLFDKFFLDILF